MSHLHSTNILDTVSGIDAKVVATTNLFQVPAGYDAVITGATLRASVATAVTQRPTLGIGVAQGEDDIFSSTALTGFTTVEKIWHFTSVGITVIARSGEVIKLGIDNGSNATTHTIEVDLIGYLIPAS